MALVWICTFIRLKTETMKKLGKILLKGLMGIGAFVGALLMLAGIGFIFTVGFTVLVGLPSILLHSLLSVTGIKILKIVLGIVVLGGVVGLVWTSISETSN